jgi:hypothetical protein
MRTTPETQTVEAPILTTPVAISLNSNREFTLAQANDLLPLIYRITEEANKAVRKQINRIEAVKGTKPEIISLAEAEIDKVTKAWSNKMLRLGVYPKGHWLCDFDSGHGYYCWKFPENQVKYFHGYKDGFSGRIEVQ